MILGLSLYLFLQFTRNVTNNYAHTASITQLVAYKDIIGTPYHLESEIVVMNDVRLDMCNQVNTALYKHGFVFIETNTDISMHIAIWFKYLWNTSVVLLTINDDASYLSKHLYAYRPSRDNIIIVRFVAQSNTSEQKNYILDNIWNTWVVVVYIV